MLSFRFYNIHYFLESFITNFIIIIAKNANITNTTDSKIIPCKSIKNKPLKINYDIIITIKKGERMPELATNITNSAINNEENLLHSVTNLVRESFLQVVRDSIDKIPQLKVHQIKRGYSAKIDMIFNENCVFVALLMFNKDFLKIMCRDFLLEEHPDLPTVIDMGKELANLTIGHAKVLGQQHHIAFNISMPYLGVSKNNKKPDISYELENKGYCNIFITEK